MKKLFISMLAAAFSMAVIAAPTAIAKITLTGESGGSDELTLVEDATSHTNDFESGYDGENMMSLANSTSVLLYALVGTHNCQMVFDANLDGRKLGITTNTVDTNYKLKFTNISGRALKLFDRVAGQLVDIAENGEYDFTVDASLVGQKQIKDRFEIGEPAKSLCFRYNTLEVIGYAGKKLAVKDANGTEIVPETTLGVFYSKDLSDKHGRLIVVLDGKEIQIDATPDVTPAN